jgi:hypothetical protein
VEFRVGQSFRFEDNAHNANGIGTERRRQVSNQNSAASLATATL